MKKVILFIVLICSGIRGWAQFDEISKKQQSLKHITNRYRYVDTLNKIGLLMYEKDPDSMLFYIKKAKAMADQLGYRKGQGGALNNLGIFFSIKGNQELALSYLNDSRNVSDNKVNITQTIMNIALVYKAFGKEKKAIENIDLAMKSEKEMGYSRGFPLVVANYIYIKRNYLGYDSIKWYVNKGVKIGLNYNDRRAIDKLRSLQARSDIYHGNRAQGIKEFKSIVAEAEKDQFYFITVGMLIDLGKILMETDSASGIKYLKRALEIAERSNYIEFRFSICQTLKDNYGKLENKDQELFYSRKLLSVFETKDSLNRVSKIDYLDYALKNQQVKQLKVNAEYRKIILWISITAFIVVAIAAFLIWKGLVKAKKFGDLVESKNLSLEHALAALEESFGENSECCRLWRTISAIRLVGLWPFLKCCWMKASRPRQITKYWK